jgi:hypothetical protein
MVEGFLLEATSPIPASSKVIFDEHHDELPIVVEDLPVERLANFVLKPRHTDLAVLCARTLRTAPTHADKATTNRLHEPIHS